MSGGCKSRMTLHFTARTLIDGKESPSYSSTMSDFSPRLQEHVDILSKNLPGLTFKPGKEYDWSQGKPTEKTAVIAAWIPRDKKTSHLAGNVFLDDSGAFRLESSCPLCPRGNLTIKEVSTGLARIAQGGFQADPYVVPGLELPARSSAQNVPARDSRPQI